MQKELSEAAARATALEREKLETAARLAALERDQRAQSAAAATATRPGGSQTEGVDEQTPEVVEKIRRPKKIGKGKGSVKLLQAMGLGGGRKQKIKYNRIRVSPYICPSSCPSHTVLLPPDNLHSVTFRFLRVDTIASESSAMQQPDLVSRRASTGRISQTRRSSDAAIS